LITRITILEKTAQNFGNRSTELYLTANRTLKGNISATNPVQIRTP